MNSMCSEVCVKARPVFDQIMSDGLSGWKVEHGMFVFDQRADHLNNREHYDQNHHTTSINVLIKNGTCSRVNQRASSISS